MEATNTNTYEPNSYERLEEVMNQMCDICSRERKTKFEELVMHKVCKEHIQFLESQVNTFNTRGIRSNMSRYGTKHPTSMALICIAWAEVMTRMKKDGRYDDRNKVSANVCEQFYLSYTRIGVADFSGHPTYKNFVSLFMEYYPSLHRTNCQTLTQVLFEGIIAGKSVNGMHNILENAFGEDLEAATRMPLI